ncbi:hypothetical protein [Bacillus sp. T33-2]|uniref:hypothetical protein n=1 Tax=Bacillus sp. T33-2 TaxID=2054168 RepID=UPI000C785953|nr:hypothetical protein [Bacillus sp. T33-2]PLR95870.1 hypothetical protein CVD19_12625 [Bacillus sp. T33-2]
MSYLKRLTILGVSLCFLLLVGCEEASETAKKVTDEVEEAVQAEATKDNEFVLSVKEGSLSSHPDVKIKDAFANFFSSSTWKYFQAETGERVVEFTGYCTYMEKKVKAKLQFIVEEGKESFEIGALEFNDVPQNDLTKAALIQAIYEGEDSSASQTENDAPVETASQTENDAPVETASTEESINGITAEYAIELYQQLESYPDLVANGDTFSEPTIYEDEWVVYVSRPSGTSEGTIIIDEFGNVTFMAGNGDILETLASTSS